MEYICAVCSSVFSSEAILNKHMEEHNFTFPYYGPKPVLNTNQPNHHFPISPIDGCMSYDESFETATETWETQTSKLNQICFI